MIRFNTIQIDGVYLTSDGTDTGTEYISLVSGLTPMKLTTPRLVRRAIDGTPRAQFRPKKGYEIGVNIPLIKTSDYDDLIDALNATEAADQDHACMFTGDKGTFDLTCVLVGIDDSGDMQDAGHRNFKATFWVKTVN